MNAAERKADWWLFGGIYRPVWLEAKPQIRIEHIAVDAKMDGEMQLYTELKGVKGKEKINGSFTSFGWNGRLFGGSDVGSGA